MKFRNKELPTKCGVAGMVSNGFAYQMTGWLKAIAEINDRTSQASNPDQFSRSKAKWEPDKLVELKELCS